MDAVEDKIAEILHRLYARPSRKANRVDCPSEETLAVFLSGRLEEGARELVEAHLAQCASCLEDLVAGLESGQDYASERIPQQLMNKVMEFVKAKESPFALAVRLVKDSIELISTSARVVPMPVPAIRSAAKPSEANALQVEQEVGRFRIAVELELSETGTCQVVANVTEETGAPAEGVRLSLNSGDREQASFLTRGGIVVFDRIAPGEYSIAVSESGTHVGRIKLTLML